MGNPPPMICEERPRANGSFDELIVRDVKMVHVGTMTKKSVYIGFYAGDQGVQFWIIATKKGKLTYHYETFGGVEVSNRPENS